MRDLSGVISLVLLLALTLGAGCKSKPAEQPDEPPVEQLTEEEEVVEAEPEPEPEPPPFCAEGADEYTRREYRWCKRDGVLDGNFQVSYDDGETELEGRFVAGALEGPWTAYYMNGERRWSVTFANNLEEGDLQGWYDTGQPHYVIPYKAGKREGTATYFYPNGQKAAELQYVAGKAQGTWTYWHENGQKAHEYTVEGDKTSIHRHWDEQGNKKKAQVGQMPKSSIVPVVEPLGELIVRCYQHARIFDDSSGKLVAQFVIGYGGEVSSVTIFESDFEHPFMSACTRRNVESLTFPDNPYGPKTLIRSWQLSVE